MAEPEIVYTTALPLEAACSDVAAQLGLRFEARESSYWGGAYYRATVSTGEAVIHSNADAIDGEPIVDGATATASIARVSVPGVTLGPPWIELA